MTIFGVKSTIILCKLAQFFLPFQKYNNLIFCDICGYKKGRTTNFSPFSFVAVVGCGIRDPGSWMDKNPDPGSGINIPDLQHWSLTTGLHQVFSPITAGTYRIGIGAVLPCKSPEFAQSLFCVNVCCAVPYLFAEKF